MTQDRKEKFSALGEKIKEHAAQSIGTGEESSGRAKTTAAQTAAAVKPTAANTTAVKPTAAAVKPTAGSAAAVKPTAAAVKPTAAAVKPTAAVKPAAAAPASRFTDIPAGAYYADAVNWAVQNGITTGVTETTFVPDGPCHRGHAATFIWRAKGSPAPRSDSNPYTDVADGPFYKAILWASWSGIMKGTSGTTFGPKDPCTRAEALTYLCRAEGKRTATEADALKWAAEKKLLAGQSGGVTTPCTRADMVFYLFKLYQ